MQFPLLLLLLLLSAVAIQVNSQCSDTLDTRLNFNTETFDNAYTSCWQGQPCSKSTYLWSSNNGRIFSTIGQYITCSSTSGCQYVNSVGITTYSGSTTVCQGRWRVECDGVSVGTISSSNHCVGSSFTNNCRLTFPGRYCTNINFVIEAGFNGGSGCCDAGGADAMLTSVSIWADSGVSLPDEGTCTDGTENDPNTQLPDPVMVTPTISANYYNLGFDIDKRYNAFSIEWGNVGTNPCNYGSDDWSTADSTGDPNCVSTVSFSRAAQDTLVTCEFVRTDAGGFALYRQTLSITTNQTRYINHTQSLRNASYFALKTTHFGVEVRVPINVTASTADVNVTGNITVLQAISSLRVSTDPQGTNPQEVSFTLLTSSQNPYRLTYTSFTSSADLANTITITDTTPSCSDTGALTPCVQQFPFSGLTITTPCPTKDQLSSEAMTVTFAVGCKPSFGGNCITPEPAQITVSFTLSSGKYCPLVDNITVTGDITTYADVDLAATSAWQASSQSTQFVIGSTLFGRVDISVVDNIATLATTTMQSLATVGDNNVKKTVYTSGGGGLFGAAVQNGGGPVNYPNDASSARFSIPLIHGDTVHIDGTLDAAQTITIQAVVDLTFVQSKQLEGTADSPLLKEWAVDEFGQTYRANLQSTAARTDTATGSFVLTPPAQASASGGSASPMSNMSVVAGMAVAACLVVVGVSYFVGARRREEDDTHETDQKISVELQMQIKSSSCAALPLEETQDDSVDNSFTH